jgi:hypothetical protein
MNKGELRVHFKDLLNRSDITDTLADTFVDQSISRIQRTLRVPSMEKQMSYTIVDKAAFLFLPNDFLEIIDFYYDSTSLTRLPFRDIMQLRDGGESGTPKFFAREGGSLVIYPYPSSGSVKLNYYGEFAKMTADTDENNLAASSSDMIIYGALSFASDYYLDERGPLFEQRFMQLLTEVQEQANDAEMSGTVQVMRPTAVYED